MKRLVLLCLASIALVNARFSVSAAEDAPAGTVVVYYFHGTFRCSTCSRMEAYAKEAVEANFKEALASGRLAFKAVNVEERGNEHFVTDYQFYTKSLILAFVKDGKAMLSKNLDRIWEFAGNKQKFIAYVTEEVGAFLKETQ